ncbi:hypothetical protein JCM11251_004196 [Rhodosporidiobolus azoricus]
MLAPVEFQQGRLGRPPEDGPGLPVSLSVGAPLLPPLPATSEGACITPADLYRFLDDLPSSSSAPSNLFNSTPSSTGSTSLPFTTTSTVPTGAPVPGPLFTLDGANNAFGLDALFSSAAKEQDAVQPSTAFTAPAKAFDAGDILLPFDLTPSSISVSSTDLLAFPVFDTTGLTSQLPPLSLMSDPLSLDATLDSPLGLTGSGCASSNTSPLSEFLASPMFSAHGSSMPSTTFSELPLPSPATAAPSFFPPLPTLPSTLDFSSSVLPTTTFLRPSTPLPSPPAASSTFSAVSSTKAKGKRPTKPTGFAPTATPLLALDAPIQSRNSVLPSATSRKRKTAQAEKALAKRRKSGSPDEEEGTPAPPAGAGEEDDLPADIVAAVERKRLQNTLSARKSRARKQARLQELETENEQLKAKVEELERMLAMAAGRA